ncbi:MULTISPECIES: tetratricopeptide repeat protein [Niastella]|uniref:Tetratricopeptide repeat protein n=1 Tax=Niastella soli TaxID=2821487 RepID=A0ABS3YUY2_9BACT|nr:tetratricopeptide repeat protein [Niastella soli]MBO9201734.1 tetratricopeptide repeat protein [Niastella soli]
MKTLSAILMLGLISNGVYSQTDSTEFYYRKGILEQEARRYREAEKNFAKAAQFSPKAPKVLLGWGQSLIEQRRYVEAREKFSGAYQADNKNTDAVLQLATLSLNTRQWNEAITYAKKMQELKIGNSANYIMVKSYYGLENYGECVKYCELAYKDDPKNAEVPYIAGRCLVDMSNYKKAAGCFEQAITLDSSKANWMYEAALVYYAVPDDKKAIYWFERAAAKGYPRSNDFIENLANAYLNVKNYDKGLGLLQEVLVKKPQDQELLYNIADAYYNMGKYDDAISYWDKLLELDKKNANSLYMIGLSYQKKGEKEKGQQLCDKAIEMDPSLKNLKEEKKMPGGI